MDRALISPWNGAPVRRGGHHLCDLVNSAVSAHWLWRLQMVQIRNSLWSAAQLLCQIVARLLLSMGLPSHLCSWDKCFQLGHQATPHLCSKVNKALTSSWDGVPRGQGRLPPWLFEFLSQSSLPALKSPHRSGTERIPNTAHLLYQKVPESFFK